jgi:ribosome-binding ATPase YchF (GTP1/OBG family)
VIHVDGRVNPVEDVATINFELALSDLLQVERRIDRLRKGKAKSPTEKAQEATELEVLERVSSSLESGIPVRVLKLSEVAINYQLRMIITFNGIGRKCIAIHPQFTDSKTMYICCECL